MNAQHKAMNGTAVLNQQRSVLPDFGRTLRTMCIPFDSITSSNMSWVQTKVKTKQKNY